MATFRTISARVSALITAPAIGIMLALAPAAFAEPEPAVDANTCPYRVTTPPAVDSSEVPEFGDPPAPLPVPAKPDPAAATITTANAALPDVNALPVRVGVGVVGAIVVFVLIMGARALNRRPQY